MGIFLVLNLVLLLDLRDAFVEIIILLIQLRHTLSSIYNLIESILLASTVFFETKKWLHGVLVINDVNFVILGDSRYCHSGSSG